ncbi:hypothetical protein [Pengzhenrongella sicca]|uniref:DUF3592 domain-containing protein n=1 Tax=Pengzhenrongella sicca TaxID=2819238 RepID=A0A8A4ZG44_9MICO|nr:hypothetical protein [Pengzhenrongella sicca]QTE29969.1 hypothetical protein J4E96_02780 [Pengzhenrongella sicca]
MTGTAVTSVPTTASGPTTIDDLGPVGIGLVIAVLVLFALASLAVFAYKWRGRRVYTHGLRGQAAIAEVRQMSTWQRYSVTSPPTESVVVATAAMPRGVSTDQAFPRGTFAPGQIVPVVQRPGDSSRLYVDVPGQAPSVSEVYRYLAVAVGAVAGIAYAASTL